MSKWFAVTLLCYSSINSRSCATCQSGWIFQHQWHISSEHCIFEVVVGLKIRQVIGFQTSPLTHILHSWLSDLPDTGNVKFLKHKENLSFGRHQEVIHCHNTPTFPILGKYLSHAHTSLDFLEGMFKIHVNFTGMHCCSGDYTFP